MLLRSCLIFVVLGGAERTACAELKLLQDVQKSGARCMDGTPAGYYFSGNTSSHQWIIDLEGGGECASKEACSPKVLTALGSSKYFKKEIGFGFIARGPRFQTFNRVFVPYCSQDLWTGQRRTATNETFSFFFSGHLILDAILTDLERVGGLNEASDIILTGESAGGIGVWPNLDWLAARYSNAVATDAPIAGFYFWADPYTGPGHTSSALVDFRETAWPSHVALWQSFVDADCAAAIEPWRCVLANNTYPFITSPHFIIEAQSDKVVLGAHDWVPTSQAPHWSAPVVAYLKEWAHNMSIALSPAMAASSPNGVFSPACFIHTGFTQERPIIRGMTYIEAFSAWYLDNKTVKLQDTCGVMCGQCP